MPRAHAELKAARAAIAAACLDALPDAMLGVVRLRADQRHIVARAQRLLDRHGGCLIGEDVGRGKTYIALSLARHWRQPLVVMPASLASTWQRAMARAGVRGSVVSHEALSRGHVPAAPYDGLVVDESHHFRTTTTRRYDALALLAARAPIILLSATPLQNRVRDLSAQIALFFGERAFALDVEGLARFVVRGPASEESLMPRVCAPEWLPLDVDDSAILSAILGMPPPARPLDGGDAGALRTIGLVRAWASSRAALRATLRSRNRLSTAIEQAAEDGRQPTRREARAWCNGEDGSVQLGFAPLLASGMPSSITTAEIRDALARERDGLSRLSSLLGDTPDPDASRLCALRLLRRRHADARIIAFSEYASTIRALFAAMRADAAVGMLTARETRIASGRIGRDELLGRFAPVAQGAAPTAAHDAVTLLLTTDLLSEGVNLQDASIVVHLDLPWNPARLAQRVGRVRRPGGASEIRSYLLAPPASAAALLDADARLRRKLVAAERALGATFDVLPSLAALDSRREIELTAEGGAVGLSAAARGDMFACLASWRTEEMGRMAQPIVAAVVAERRGWLAALGDGRLIASVDGSVPDATTSVARMVVLAGGASRDLSSVEMEATLTALQLWLSQEDLAAACGIEAAPGPLCQLVLHRVARLQQRVPRHLRASTLPLLAEIRDAVHSPLPLGTERQLAAHVTNPSQATDDATEWSTTALQLLRARNPRHGVRPRTMPSVVAVVVAGPSIDE